MDPNEIAMTANYCWILRSSDLVGRGAFGKVQRGRHIKTGEFVAIKTCDKNTGQNHQKEIDLLKQMDSSHVVKFIAAEEIINSRGQKAIIMELADSNVRDELKKLENLFGLPYKVFLRLLDHLRMGLFYLNSGKIAHRDLKPENILIFNKPDGMLFKLCDFGVSRVVFDNFQPLHSICGTPGYLNEYLAANLARKTQALSYTKDECDLWSVGCTLFECATGVLPFLPPNGVSDAAVMHSMMSSRPSDAISVCVDDRGQFVWMKDLPEDRCFYPRSLRRVLREFIRNLFDRRPHMRLTFLKFAQMCEEIVNLKRINVYKANRFLLEEYFDTSTAVHFEHVYFDDYAIEGMPEHNVLCLITLPAGTAITYHLPTQSRSLIDNCTDVVILALNKQTKTYPMPLSLPELPVIQTFSMNDRDPSLSVMRRTAASALFVERQTNALFGCISQLVTFCRSVRQKCSHQFEHLLVEHNLACRLVGAVQIQSEAIALGHDSVLERNAVENNAKQVVRELHLLSDAIDRLRLKLKKIDETFDCLEARLRMKSNDASSKEALETLIRMRMCAAANRVPENHILFEADRLFLLNIYEENLKKYSYLTERIVNEYSELSESLLKNIFDLSRMLDKTKRQLIECTQLISVTEETNVYRLTMIKNSGGDRRSMPAAFNKLMLSSVLKDFEGQARMQRLKAESSLHEARAILRHL